MTVVPIGGCYVAPEAGLIVGVKGKLIGWKHQNGYVYVRLFRQKPMFAHRLIWEAANGPIPVGMEINHKNGIKHDNRIANLEAVTRGQNMSHAYRTGLKPIQNGERHWARKLTEKDVLAIRASLSRSADLAEAYGVSIYAIQDARSGRRWFHLPFNQEDRRATRKIQRKGK